MHTHIDILKIFVNDKNSFSIYPVYEYYVSY